MLKKNLFICLVVLISATAASAANYFVRSESELKKLVSSLIPGDTVTIANGTYENWSVQISAKGTAAKPIILKAETLGKVIFSGSVTEPIFKFTGSNLVLSGLSFRDCKLLKAGKSGVLVEFQDADSCLLSECNFLKNQATVQFMPLVIVSGNGTNNKIERCMFESTIDAQDIQVKVTKESCPQYTLITHNLFKDKPKVTWKNGNGGECVQVGQDPIMLGTVIANTSVTYNNFFRCNGESEIISNKSSKNIYTNNLFEENDGELVMRGGHDCIISNNKFNGGTGGIRINGTGHMITNNQINDVKTAIRLMYGMAKGKNEIGFYIAAGNCTVKHNLIENATTGILIGDSKDIDWTGKFDTKRYPSPVLQNVPPYQIKLVGNKFTNTVKSVVKISE